MIDYLLLILATATAVLLIVGLVAYLKRDKPKPLDHLRDWDEYVPPNDCIKHTLSVFGPCVCGPTVQIKHHALQTQ